MPPYECERCHRQIYDKQKYEVHCNRKFPCTPQKPHGNVKLKDDNKCEHCNKTLATKSSLKRHIGSQHNDENNRIQNHIETQNINITNVKDIINVMNVTYPYYHYNIQSMPLICQYRILTDIRSPYRGILDYFNLNKNNLEYHNIRMPNIKRGYMDIYTDKWTKDLNTNVLSKLVFAHAKSIEIMYDKFRIFLCEDAFRIINSAYYHGMKLNKKIMRDIKFIE